MGKGTKFVLEICYLLHKLCYLTISSSYSHGKGMDKTGRMGKLEIYSMERGSEQGKGAEQKIKMFDYSSAKPSFLNRLETKIYKLMKIF